MHSYGKIFLRHLFLKPVGAAAVKGSGDRHPGWHRPASRSAAPVLFALILICVSLYGCGPGFPIQTAAQEAYINNVDTLMKENEALKKRVSRLEKGGTADAARMREEVDEVKVSAAEATGGLQEMRQEFSFIRGSLEESVFDRSQIKEDIKFTGETIKNISSRLDAMEAPLMASDERLAAVEATLASLEKRLESLEKKDVPSAEKTKKTDPEELYAKGLKHIKEKKYREGTESFVKFLKEFPDHKLAGHAQYWLGEIYYTKGDWEKAILEFNKVIKSYPKGEKVAAATLKQGFSFEKLGSVKEARMLLEQVISKFPDSNEAKIAKKRLRDLKPK